MMLTHFPKYEDKTLNGKHDAVLGEYNNWNSGAGPGETDPELYDTDDDTYNDRMEIEAETNPLLSSSNPDDQDSDGLYNWFEDNFYYDYSLIDWDSDGNTDYTTDPGSTDPGYDNEAAADTDSDGLLDGEERLSWPMDYEVYDCHKLISPLNPDCDFDGILDGKEDNYKNRDEGDNWEDSHWYEDNDGDGKINPVDKDSDNDRLKDNEEAIVTFRSNTNEYDLAGVWIAVDTDDDGELEGFGRNETYSGIPSGGYEFTQTPEGKAVYMFATTTDFIYVCYSADNKPVYSRDQVEASEAILTSHPLYKYLYKETWNWYTDPTNPDTDEDGLTDYDEINEHYTDPKNPNSDGDEYLDGYEILMGWDPNDPNGDADGDGLSDSDEVDIGTDPNVWDTDDDDLPDGWEYYYYNYVISAYSYNGFLDPLNDDSNGDGILDCDEIADIKYNAEGGEGTYETYYFVNDYLSNYQEWFWDLSPFKEDYDEDGYYDGVEIIEVDELERHSFEDDEITNGVYVASHPRIKESQPGDVDGDTHDEIDNDGDEITDELGWADTDVYPHDTEGIDIFDADDDNDGWLDVDEMSAGEGSEFNPGVDGDPCDDDTDDDGVLDGVEVHTDGTDPLDPWDNLLDSDEDNINDYTELNTIYEESEIDWDGDHIFDYCTDPNNADTDGDGCRDDWEIDGWSLTIFDLLTGDEVTSLSRDVSSEPLIKDTDGDTLLDGSEYMISDPTSYDTDGDHISDQQEIRLKSLSTGIDGEPPKISWDIQKIDTNYVDGGLVNVECSLDLDAIDYSGLEYLKIQLKTNDGSADTLESWSKDSLKTENINIHTTKKFYPRDSYDVIFKAKDIDGHVTTATKHIDSGWETFINILNQAAQAFYEYVTGPVKTWVLSTAKTNMKPTNEGFLNRENPSGGADFAIYAAQFLAISAFLAPFMALRIITSDDLLNEMNNDPISWGFEITEKTSYIIADVIMVIVTSCIPTVAYLTAGTLSGPALWATIVLGLVTIALELYTIWVWTHE